MTQFAYNEASFMLIRLLQSFDQVELAPEAQPLDARPPKEWQAAGGRQAVETVIPKTHLTMYSHVSHHLDCACFRYFESVISDALRLCRRACG